MAARIVIVGGGYVGLYTALQLQKRLGRAEAQVTVINPQSYMTYQPFLPEAAAGSVEPRHVVVPLRRVLRGCTVLAGRATGLDHDRRVVTFTPLEGSPREIGYDHVVLAAGSVSRTLPIPGLAEHGIGFKTVAEAIYLRNHVLARLDAAAATPDPEIRRRALTFCFIGGGYAGIEAFAELEDLARHAIGYYPDLRATDMRWVLIEASPRILPEVSPDLAGYTVRELHKRGMEVRLRTRVSSLAGGHVVLDDGTEFDAETIVWTAGVRPQPVVGSTGLPTDAKGRVRATAELTVEGVPGAWTAGDCAAVPDLTQPGEYCSPSAQHAVRQAKLLGDNLVAALRGERLTPYRHAYAGSVASLGLYQGVAQVYGVKLRGYPAWFMHRTYHMTRMPTLNRKVRVVADWTLALLFRREIVSLGSFQNPRAEFVAAATEEPGG